MFEGQNKVLVKIGCDRRKLKIKPTEVQPRSISNRVKKDEIGMITDSNPLGEQDHQPKNRLQNQLIRGLGRQIKDQ